MKATLSSRIKMDAFLIELQEIIAHQQQTIDALSDEIYQQQQELRECQTQCALLTKQMRLILQQDSGINAPEQDMPPPHY